MADVKKKSVVACSGQLNRNGYRVETSGIQLDGFLANPIMLFQHNRSNRYEPKNNILPIGRWENIRIENGQLMADPVFDTEDELGKEVARKWEAGFLNAVSIGFNFLEWSDNPIHLVQGQTRPTVTKAELVEISIVDIPADANAVRINNAADEKDPLSMLPLLKTKTIVKSENQNLMDNKTLCLSLGLPENATSEQISAAIAKLTNAPKVEAALSLGRTKGIVNADNEAAMRTMVEANPDAFQLAWTAVPTPSQTLAAPTTVAPTQTLAAALREVSGQQAAPQTAATDDRKTWSMKDWRMKDADGLLALEKDNPTEFNRLVKTMVATGKAVL